MACALAVTNRVFLSWRRRDRLRAAAAQHHPASMRDIEGYKCVTLARNVLVRAALHCVFLQMFVHFALFAANDARRSQSMFAQQYPVPGATKV